MHKKHHRSWPNIYNENLNEWANEHKTNENIRRGHRIPTIESEIKGEKLCNIYRWRTTNSSTYLNRQQAYNAEINYLNIKCEDFKEILNNKNKTTS